MAKPSFGRHGMPISDNLAIIQCKIQAITLNRPIFVGFTVLELSKLHMYDFHYNHMKMKYPRANELKLLFTDTDGLAYAIKQIVFTKIWLLMLQKSMILASTQKIILYTVPPIKKPWGILKMKEFVGLRPKYYAFKCTGKMENNTLQHSKPVEKKTAKVIKRKVKGPTPAFPPLSGCFQKLPLVCVQTEFNFITISYCTFSPSKKDRTDGIRYVKVAV